MLHPILEKTTSQLLGTQLVSGDVGLELEIEGDNLPRSVTNWSRKPEGSLRGRDGRTVDPSEDAVDTPQEYISRGPILLSSLRGNLNALCTRLTTGGSSVRITPRASTHIHLNMTGDTVQTALFYIMVFTVYEPTILRMCGPLRNGNLFCLPSYETGELPIWMTRLHKVADYWPSTDHIRHYWPKRGKYSSINTDPLTTLGSIETRCFPNSVDPETICQWAEWLVKIRGIARELTFDTASQFLDRAYAEPMVALQRIFTLDSRLHMACAPIHPAELVSYGVEHAYEIFRSAQAFADYTDKKSRKKKVKEEFVQIDWPEPREMFEDEI